MRRTVIIGVRVIAPRREGRDGSLKTANFVSISEADFHLKYVH
jgi:hypothetical protein